MFCFKCGTSNTDEAHFCSKCGVSLQSPKDTVGAASVLTQQQIEKPTPVALIATTWVLIVLSFIPMGQVSFIVSIAILICSIFLIASKNKIGKTNGWIVMAIWIITFIIGFLIAKQGHF